MVSFLDCLVVRIPGFHCCDAGSIPGGGTEIQQDVRSGQKKKNYFRTRNQRGRRRIRRECYMGIQDQRMSGHWQEGQMPWKVRLRTGKPTSFKRLWWPFWELTPEHGGVKSQMAGRRCQEAGKQKQWGGDRGYLLERKVGRNEGISGWEDTCRLRWGISEGEQIQREGRNDAARFQRRGRGLFLFWWWEAGVGTSVGKPGGEEDSCWRSSNPIAPLPMMKWAGLSVESERNRESEGGFRKGTLCEAGKR